MGLATSLSPFSVRAGNGAPPLAVMARVCAAAWLVTGHALHLPAPFLPFVPLPAPLQAPSVRVVLVVLSVAACLVILFTDRWRAGAIALGLTILAATVVSRPWFANNRVYMGLVLLLAGLDPGDGKGWPVRVQVVLLYLGAGLDKLFSPGWLDGTMLDSLSRGLSRYGTLWAPGGRLGLPDPVAAAYVRLAGALPERWLARGLSWAVIAAELGIAIALCFRRTRRPALCAIVVLHAAITLWSGSTFGVFLHAAFAGCLAFLEWPASIEVRARAASWPRLPSVVAVEGQERVGVAAVAAWVAWHPATYLLGALLLSGPWFRSWVPAALGLLVILAHRAAAPAPRGATAPQP